jgi:hypothetical protein
MINGLLGSPSVMAARDWVPPLTDSARMIPKLYQADRQDFMGHHRHIEGVRSDRL